MKRLAYTLNILFFSAEKISAQAPRFSPTQSSNFPIDFSSTSDVVLFLILPILFIILIFLAWKKNKKRNH